MNMPPPQSTIFPYTTLFRSTVFHTYSSYARGIDMLNTAYHYLDLVRSEEHTFELQSHHDLVCRLLLETKTMGRRGSARKPVGGVWPETRLRIEIASKWVEPC